MQMFNRKGQNIAEYSILIALVVAAAVAMQVYVKRGVQGKIADAVDHSPDVAIMDGGTVVANLNYHTPQYEPYYLDSRANVSSGRGLTENVTANGKVVRDISGEVTTRQTGAYEKSKWVSENAR